VKNKPYTEVDFVGLGCLVETSFELEGSCLEELLVFFLLFLILKVYIYTDEFVPAITVGYLFVDCLYYDLCSLCILSVESNKSSKQIKYDFLANSFKRKSENWRVLIRPNGSKVCL